MLSRKRALAVAHLDAVTEVDTESHHRKCALLTVDAAEQPLRCTDSPASIAALLPFQVSVQGDTMVLLMDDASLCIDYGSEFAACCSVCGPVLPGAEWRCSHYCHFLQFTVAVPETVAHQFSLEM